MNRRYILRWLMATAVAMVSWPLSLAVVDYHFTLASLLIVPAFVAAVWLTVTASEERRVWWFGYAVTLGACLPLCPVADQWLTDGAVYLQRLSQRGVISLSQRVIEPAIVFLEVLGPPVVASLLGAFVGNLLQRVTKRRSPSVSAEVHRGQWRYSLREMLIAFSAIGLIAAWNAGHTRHWESLEKVRQIAFLARFTASFSSGTAELLGEPRIEELQRTRMREYGMTTFRAAGVNEYRIVAPIKINGNDVWAVWSYTCNEQAGEMIYKYAYAAVPNYTQLPQFPFPAQRYIDITSDMVDGVPVTAGATVAITSVTSPTRAGEPFSLTATAPPGTLCEVRMFPGGSLPGGAPQNPDKSGKVSWTWNVPDALAGHRITYEIDCVETRGSNKLRSTTRGSVTVVGSRSPN